MLLIASLTFSDPDSQVKAISQKCTVCSEADLPRWVDKGFFKIAPLPPVQTKQSHI